jgi:hypothetical protein
MALEDQVKVMVTSGEECFVCEKKILPSKVVIQVGFRVNLIITSKFVEYQMHPACAERLRDVLIERIDEARAEEAS